MTLAATVPRPERPSEAMGRRRVARARVAVSAIFFQQGLLVGGWALQIPKLIDRLGITESTMGLVIVVFGTGSILAMLGLGPVIDRFGSRAVTRGTAIGTCFFLVLLNLTPSVWTTAVAAFAIGALVGAIDVAMNAQAVEVERRRRRPIMSSFHAYWSMGTLVGASVSGAIIASIGPLWHAVSFMTLSLAVAAAAWPHLVRERVSAGAKRQPFHLPRAPAVWLLGLICLFAYVPEGAAVDWSALYMRDGIGASLTVAGLALAGLQVTMMVMRFAGDTIRERIGGETTLRYGAAVAAFGFGIAGFAGMMDASAELRAALVIGGFVVAGLGLANIVPVAFAACGSVPGVPPGSALSIVAMHGYAGILLAPSAIGWIGERTGFAPVFAALAVPLLLIALLAAVVRPTRR